MEKWASKWLEMRSQIHKFYKNKKNTTFYFASEIVIFYNYSVGS